MNSSKKSLALFLSGWFFIYSSLAHAKDGCSGSNPLGAHFAVPRTEQSAPDGNDQLNDYSQPLAVAENDQVRIVIADLDWNQTALAVRVRIDNLSDRLLMETQGSDQDRVFLYFSPNAEEPAGRSIRPTELPRPAARGDGNSSWLDLGDLPSSTGDNEADEIFGWILAFIALIVIIVLIVKYVEAKKAKRDRETESDRPERIYLGTIYQEILPHQSVEEVILIQGNRGWGLNLDDHDVFYLSFNNLLVKDTSELAYEQKVRVPITDEIRMR